MRKHDVRKWLHAILDLLPLVVIPVFMVYSHRHTIDSYSVTVPKYDTVDFNQLSNVDNVVDDVNSNLFITIEDNYAQATLESYSGVDSSIYYFVNVASELDLSHYYLIELRDLSYTNNGFSIRLGAPTFQLLYDFSTTSYTPIRTNNLTSIQLGFDGRYSANVDFPKTISFYIQVFDLTQMFGSGNEPTVEQFNTLFTDDYYDYVLSKNTLIQVGTVTYDKTDIGNQMFYSLYNTVEQQFNFTKVFNFGDLYNFLNLNLFGGNAPLSIFVIYNIIIYEFLMDMIFIIYSVLMFLIDFVEDMFDKVFTRSKHGGN